MVVEVNPAENNPTNANMFSFLSFCRRVRAQQSNQTTKNQRRFTKDNDKKNNETTTDFF